MTTLSLGKRTYADPSEFPVPVILGPARKLERIIKGTDFAGGPCRGIWCGIAGVLNFTDYEGNVHTGFPVHVGDNNIMAQSVEVDDANAFSAAADLWAMY